MFGLSFPAAPRTQRELRLVTKRVALCAVALPAVLVAGLFVVRPEALGSPATKLALMAAAGCLLVALGELSDALTKWALPHLSARLTAEGRRRSEPPSAGTVLDVLTSATLTAGPPSTRFS